MTINTEVCTNCGLCLSVCPIYRLTLNERFSPRGKINLYNYCLRSGNFDDDSICEAFNRCLFCGRCQKVCPAGINILSIISNFRNKIASKNAPILSLLSLILKNPSYLNTFSALLQVKDLGLINENFVNLKNAKKIFIFAGCFYRSIVEKNVKALKAVKEIIYSDRQVCCGLPLIGAGRDDEIKHMIEKNLSLMREFSPEIILTLCDSCYFVIRNIWKEYIKDPIKIETLNKFFKLSDYIDFTLTGINDKFYRINIYYHRPCHDLGNFSIEKLEKSLNKEIIRLPDGCCGFGGFFSLKFKDDSKHLFKRIVKDIKFNIGDIILTTCSGCQYQFRKNLKRLGVKVIHPLSLGICD